MALRWDKVRSRELGRSSDYARSASEEALRRVARPDVKINKTDTRIQLSDALARYCGDKLVAVECRCGHKREVRVPVAWRGHFRCSACGARKSK